MRKTLKILFLAVMLLVMVGMTMLFASAEGEPFEVLKESTSQGTFATFNDAYAKAKETGADTIKLLADASAGDIAIDSTLTFDGQSYTLTASGFTVNAGGILTITGGKYTLSANKAVWVLNGGRAVVQNADFTFTYVKNTSGAWPFVADTGTDAAGTYGLTLTNVKMKSVSSQTKYALVANAGRRVLIEGDAGSYMGELYVKGSYVKITGGYFDGSAPKTGTGDYFLKFVSGGGAGTVDIEGGTFVAPKNSYLLTMTVDNSTLNISGGTFMTPEGYAVNNNLVHVNNATSQCTITGGTFIQGTTGTAACLAIDGYGGTLIVNGGNFYSSKNLLICSSAGTMTVNGGNFYLQDGATLIDEASAAGFTKITFNKTADKAPYIIIGTGSAIPSENLPGYDGQYANATWEITGAAGVEAVVSADLTITTIAGLAAVADAAYERFFATALNGYQDIKVGAGGNCIINKASDALASIIVPSGVTLTLAMEEAVDVSIPLVIVKTGGKLVIEKGVYTNTVAEMFENEAGSTVTIKGGTFGLGAFGINGIVTIETGNFTIGSVAVNEGGKLSVTAGEFEVTSTDNQNAFVINVGGFADIQGGNWDFTNTSSWCIRIAKQLDAEQADTEPSLILGANVTKLSKNSYAFVVQANRMALVEGGEYYGRVYVCGTLEIDDGKFEYADTLISVTKDSGFSGDVTINDGEFKAKYIGVDNGCSLTVIGGKFTLTGDGAHIAITISGTATISGGTFALNGTLNCSETGRFTISGGAFVADGSFNMFASTGALTVTGGTFTVKNGAAVAKSFAGITLAPQDDDVNNLKFVIEAGSGVPSVNVEGAEVACINAYWDIRSWSGFEVRKNTTFNSLADYAEAVKEYAESSISEYNPGFIADYNYEVNIEVTWANVVVAEGVLTLNMDLAGADTLVTVEQGGKLIVAGGTYEVTGDNAMFVLNGGALEIQGGTYTAKAFVTDTADSAVTIKDGTFNVPTFNVNFTVNIENGTFNVTTFNVNSTVNIENGTFNVTTFNVNSTVNIKKGTFIVNSILVNNGGKLYVEAGDFTMNSTSNKTAFAIKLGGFANLQGGDWKFTYSGSWGFYIEPQTIYAEATEEAIKDADYCFILGSGVTRLTENNHAMVVYPGRKVKIEGGQYYGRMFVSGVLDIFGGTFNAPATLPILYATNTGVQGTNVPGHIKVHEGDSVFTGAYIYLTGDNKLTINGGTFNLSGTSAGLAINNMGTVTITGGTFNTATIKASNAGKFDISGGNFTFDKVGAGVACDFDGNSVDKDGVHTYNNSAVISGGATFTVKADIPFLKFNVEDSVTFNNVKVTAPTFMSADAAAGTLEVLDLFLIVTGTDEVIFDISATITKVVVVANTKNMTSDVTLSGYVQVKYAGETLYNAWVQLPASAELSTELEGGAAVQVTKPSTAGIRFKSTVSSEFAAYLLANYAGAKFTFGTLIAPADYVAAAGGFTIEKLDALGLEIAYVDIVANETLTGVENGIPKSFSGALVNLRSYTRAYAAVSYVKVETADETVMIYGAFDSTANARSAQEVAVAAKADANGPYQDMHPTIIWSTEQKAIVNMYANGDNE